MKAVLYLRAQMNLIYIYIYSSIWMKFGIRYRNVTLLRIPEFRENRFPESRTFYGRK
jgi:hypothetical protein